MFNFIYQRESKKDFENSRIHECDPGKKTVLNAILSNT